MMTTLNRRCMVARSWALYGPGQHRHVAFSVRRSVSTVPHPELAASLRDPSLLVEDDFGAAERLEVFDPATGNAIASVFNNSTAETRAAIDAAYEAGPQWSGMLAKQRSAVLEKWHDLMHEHVDDLATVMTAECGKPLAESRGEVGYAAAFLKWFAEEAKRASGDIIPQPMPGRRLLTIKQPVGVCGMITPWNFPAAMITRKIGPALAAGCTAVIKPSEDTPLSALAVVELGRRAGVPRSAMSVVTGCKAEAPLIGTELATNPSVRKISFTGSTAVGKLLMAQSANTVKRVSLELGGNAPFIVFADADLDAAVEGLMGSKFRNAGQTCVCANRIFIHDKVYDEFASKVTSKVEQMTVGHGADPSTVIGPLINSAGVDKVSVHCEDAIAKGATVCTGGKRLPDVGANFFAPTVLTNVPTDALVMQEETFGPLAPLIRFWTEDEVLGMANDTRAGLAAYFYSRDIGRCFRVAEALEYGMVGVNEGVISTEVAPFGGIKESGLGREGSHEGLDEYQEGKYLCFSGIGA